MSPSWPFCANRDDDLEAFRGHVAEIVAQHGDDRVPALDDFVRFDAERERFRIEQQRELVGLRVLEREVQARDDLFDRRIGRRSRGIGRRDAGP